MIERRSWRFSDGLLLAGLIGVAVFASRAAWADIIFNFALASEEQSHILLAPFIAAWLFWVRRARWRFCRPKWTIAGPGVMLAGWLIAQTGFQGSHLVLWHLGALLIVSGAALTIVGPDFVRNFFPAIFVLVFLLPVPSLIRQQIALPLQDITASVTQSLLEVAGFQVTSLGNVLSINGVEVAVAEACNGMRMVAALVLVAYAFVFSVPMRQEIRVLILVLSPIVAIVCNIIRLFPTVLLYGYASVETADLFHDISGWAMLPVALAMIWGVFSILRWIEIPITPYVVAEE